MANGGETGRKSAAGERSGKTIAENRRANALSRKLYNMHKLSTNRKQPKFGRMRAHGKRPRRAHDRAYPDTVRKYAYSHTQFAVFARERLQNHPCDRFCTGGIERETRGRVCKIRAKDALINRFNLLKTRRLRGKSTTVFFLTFHYICDNITLSKIPRRFFRYGSRGPARGACKSPGRNGRSHFSRIASLFR